MELMQTSPFLTYVGHATLLIEMDGLRILTDPLLRHHVGGLIRRQTPLPDQRFHHVDLVLISHGHLDHLDAPSLRLLSRTTHLVAPRGSARFLHRLGFYHITEMEAGESITVGAIQFTATFALHNSSRWPFRPKTACLGYLLRGQRCIYFAGDTDLFPGMEHMASDLDLALLPVWGWGPTLGSGHMDPRRAAEALALLQPCAAVPIHWGTFYPVGMRYWRPHLLLEPPRRFAHYARQVAPAVQVHIVQPGHSL
jgi:L-ascorbate metabolism protein UlaG (beta-lactamase superfamily)